MYSGLLLEQSPAEAGLNEAKTRVTHRKRVFSPKLSLPDPQNRARCWPDALRSTQHTL